MALKRSGILIKIVLLGLIVYAAIGLANIRERIADAEAEQTHLEQQVEVLRLQNEELRSNIEHAGDDAVIESIARSKLGLVKPGEKIFLDIGN